MVLIALPMNRRIDANHIDTINGVLEFLGPEMADISYILGTHSERRTDDEKRAWAKELFKSPLSTLVRYTKKKFVWSGMLGDKLTEEQEREALVELKRNQENTIKKAISAVPVVLTGGEDIKNRFMVSESAAKDSMTLKGMVPLMSPLVESIRFFFFFFFFFFAYLLAYLYYKNQKKTRRTQPNTLPPRQNQMPKTLRKSTTPLPKPLKY